MALFFQHKAEDTTTLDDILQFITKCDTQAPIDHQQMQECISSLLQSSQLSNDRNVMDKEHNTIHTANYNNYKQITVNMNHVSTKSHIINGYNPFYMYKQKKTLEENQLIYNDILKKRNKKKNKSNTNQQQNCDTSTVAHHPKTHSSSLINQSDKTFGSK
eukprot:241133_1